MTFRTRRRCGRRVFVFLFVWMAALSATGCVDYPAVLTQQMEAQRLASDLHVQLTKAADAANRAVMADTDEGSAAAVQEAEDATEVIDRDVELLHPILKSLGYAPELQFMETFKARFAEYRKLDAEILPLAVENTNLKAQRLSFGPSREAADAFRRSVEAAARSASRNACAADVLALKASAALLEVQVIHPRHIAEAEDAAMSRMEEQMAASEAAARSSLRHLATLVTADGRAQLTSAAIALDRFNAINKEIVTLSRRNSEVRSLALSLGRKRMVTAQCDDQLRALEEALQKHEFRATR